VVQKERWSKTRVVVHCCGPNQFDIWKIRMDLKCFLRKWPLAMSCYKGENARTRSRSGYHVSVTKTDEKCRFFSWWFLV